MHKSELSKKITRFFYCAFSPKAEIKICAFYLLTGGSRCAIMSGARWVAAPHFACQLAFCTKILCDFCAKLTIALSRNACYNKEKLRKGSRKTKVKKL